MSSNAYLSSPAVFDDQIVFVTDDDLWKVSVDGGSAQRLTNAKGRCTRPIVSPNGEWIAYIGSDNGQPDIYLIPFEGGTPRRITYTGVQTISGWHGNNHIIFSSSYESPERRTFLRKVNIESSHFETLPWGEALYYFKKGKVQLIGRANGDSARWKRYQGGTAGTIWIDVEGKGNFRKILRSIKSNLTCPRIIGERVFFISDHEGVGNIYSCPLNGRATKRHTFEKEYYVRHFESHGSKIVYAAGADIHCLDLEDGSISTPNITVASTFNQSLERFESSTQYLQNFSVSTHGQHIALTSRGQLSVFKPWVGGVIRLGDEHRRYKSPHFIKDKNDKEFVIAIEMDDASVETVVLWDLESRSPKKIAPKQDWGKIRSFTPSPKGGSVLITNNRAELLLLNIVNGNVQQIEKCKLGEIGTPSWSPHGDMFAYSLPINKATHGMKVYDTKKKEAKILLNSILYDESPVFSSCGKYIYFIGVREFNPSWSETHFDLSFPKATKVYALPLVKDAPHPIEAHQTIDLPKDDKNDKLKDKKEKKKNSATKIDWDGIDSRVISLPCTIGGYSTLFVAKEKLFAVRHGVEGLDPFAGWNAEFPGYIIESFNFKEAKWDNWTGGILDWAQSIDNAYIIVKSGGKLRLLETEGKPSKEKGSTRKDGWINLDRIKIKIAPKEEWPQIYKEAWILQKEHFWTADMSKVDWNKVYYRYEKLLPKVHTRKELSDLLWEMQGELSTSHCYEFGGDYNRKPDHQPNGSLAAEFKYRPEKDAMEITRIAKGDASINATRSPLRDHGVDLKKGDLILGVDGRPIEHGLSLFEHLEGRSSTDIELKVKRSENRKEEFVTAKTLDYAGFTHYRDWVNANREYVRRKSKNKLGYIHIPDMGFWGFSEFYRQFLSEHVYEGLVVDVRYNGGGMVSQHLLKILAQKVVGFDQTRYWGADPYPLYAVNGPMVCITNEFAGSDGDIFSHSWKLMGLGKLIGKRTWGGVIGIWPRHRLNDGTVTSQPEFSFWFKDVEWDVENYGTEPDIEVEITPDDYRKGRDPQLDKAIEVVLKDAKKNPPLKPDLRKSRPNLKLPH